MKRLPNYLEKEDLEKLNTKRLLSYLKQLNKCQESLEGSDQNTRTQHVDGVIEFKNSPIWILAYKNVKSILNEREHIEK